jgi:hypothetical protein
VPPVFTAPARWPAAPSPLAPASPLESHLELALGADAREAHRHGERLRGSHGGDAFVFASGGRRGVVFGLALLVSCVWRRQRLVGGCVVVMQKKKRKRNGWGREGGAFYRRARGGRSRSTTRARQARRPRSRAGEGREGRRLQRPPLVVRPPTRPPPLTNNQYTRLRIEPTCKSGRRSRLVAWRARMSKNEEGPNRGAGESTIPCPARAPRRRTRHFRTGPKTTQIATTRPNKAVSSKAPAKHDVSERRGRTQHTLTSDDDARRRPRGS